MWVMPRDTLEVMWEMPRDTLEVLERWKKYSTHSEPKELWKIVPALNLVESLEREKSKVF